MHDRVQVRYAVLVRVQRDAELVAAAHGGDAEPELRLKGDDFFGRRLTITYSRELTPEEEERDTRYTGAAALPESEDWLEQLK